jgi:hypothetical protein
VGWDARSLRAEVSVGLPGELTADPQETALERRYALRQVKARLHQTVARAAVIAAYGSEFFGQPPGVTVLIRWCLPRLRLLLGYADNCRLKAASSLLIGERFSVMCYIRRPTTSESP